MPSYENFGVEESDKFYYSILYLKLRDCCYKSVISLLILCVVNKDSLILEGLFLFSWEIFLTLIVSELIF